MSDFNSQEWFTVFENIAETYYSRADQNFVLFKKDSLNRIKNMYGSRLSSLKKEIYGKDNPVKDKIDHHKIAALYTQLFLETPIFVVGDKTGSGKYPSIEAILINEFFCIEIIRLIISEWDGKKFIPKAFESYKNPFLKLLNCYKENHTKIDKTRPHFHFTYALAHVIFFFERYFFK